MVGLLQARPRGKARGVGEPYVDEPDLHGHVVKYQDLVSAIDTAIKAGFKDVGLTEPNSLSAKSTFSAL